MSGRSRRISTASPKLPPKTFASCSTGTRDWRRWCCEHRVSFPEEDDNKDVRDGFADENIKLNEFLYRRVDIEDIVSAHLLAAEKAPDTRFSPLYHQRDDAIYAGRFALICGADAPRAVQRHVPEYEAEFERRGWTMLTSIDRVYVNERARTELGWQPHYDFGFLIERLAAGKDMRSPLARLIGSKGYHAESFSEGPYPVE